MPRAKQLAIGVLGPLGDEGVALVELFAYIGDVLSAHQDEVATEGYLDTVWNEEARALQFRLDRDLRPSLCLVADNRRLYVAVVGRDADEVNVLFGEGGVGERPAGSKVTTARYKRGAGATGNLTLSGIHLEKPFVVIVAGGSGAGFRRYCSCRRR